MTPGLSLKFENMSFLTVQEKELHRMRLGCVELGKLLMQEKALDGTLVPLGLLYKPSEQGLYGELRLLPRGELFPCGFIDSGYDLHINVPYANYFGWVVEHSRNLPVLAY